jgi:hypothetical protein
LKKSLEFTEWILAFCIVVVLASFLIIARLHEQKKNVQLEEFLKEKKEVFKIAISGEVLHPGVFSCQAGARLGDAVKKSRPKRFADLQGLDLDSPVKSSLEIVIPKLTQVSIRVVGAVVEPIELSLPPGSRISDLKTKVACKEGADLKFFKRQRLLKHGETIEVPERISLK